MASMTVIATSAVPDRLRGALSRWFLEVAPGLYVGTISARVRDEIWALVSEIVGDGAAVLLHPDNTEQGFTIHTTGTRRREPVDYDGLTLVRMRPLPPTDTEPLTIMPDDW
jgi:CRISPR-associated protein Cas2